jgi:protein ImuB
MTYVSLWSRSWQTGGVGAELLPLILAHAPRAALAPDGVWVDARGMNAGALVEALKAELTEAGERVSAGIAEVPGVAEVAARLAPDGTALRIPAGQERAFLAPQPLGVLSPTPRAARMLRGAGVTTCGALAALPRESIEVRFGPEGDLLWMRARGQDPRWLFAPIPHELPRAEVDFVDHSVADAGRLAFAANGLLGSVCQTLEARAQRARTLRLTLTLEGGGALERELRTRRPTGERAPWLARLREVLDSIQLPDRVSGVRLEVLDVEGVSATQGDLFDAGFATAAPVEEALARLIDRMGPVVVQPEASRHPLADRRTRWIPQEPEVVAEAHTGWPETVSPTPRLTLQRPEQPVPVQVRLSRRSGEPRPVGYCCDREGWKTLSEAAGPDRISGGLGWDDRFAREYYLATDEDGRVVWLFRDALGGRWFIQGWFD